MAEVSEPEASGSNRRVLVVCAIVVAIIIYLVGKSIHKKSVIAGLRSPDTAVRLRSTEKLMEWKILTDVLSRQPVPVKRPMIVTLREMNTGAAADELVNLMKDRNPTVQNEAQFALEKMQPTSIPNLVGALSNPDLNVKNRAAQALIRIGMPSLAPVKGETTTSVPLIDAIATPAARPGVTQVVTTLRQGAVPWLMKKLADKDADAGTKACAMDILSRLNAQTAAGPIRAALNDPKVDPAIRQAGLVALGRLRHPDAYSLLRATLSEKDPAVVNNAIVGLGELRDPRAVALLQGYLKGYDESLRDAAVEALAKIGPPAVSALSGLLKEDRYEVRVGALKVLQGIDDPRCVGVIASALRDPDENVRRMAAEALGRAGDPRVVAPLLSALGDRAWRVAIQARDSLAIVGEPAIPGLVKMLGQGAQSSSAFYAQAALEKIGAAAVPALMAAAEKGGSLPARQRAVLALGSIADTRALRLLENLSSAQTDRTLRSAAERALRQVREGRRVG